MYLEKYPGQRIANVAYDKPLKLINCLLREEVGSRVPFLQYQPYDACHFPRC